MMMTLESMTLVAVMMKILNQQQTIKGQGQDQGQNPQGPVHPVVQAQVPVLQGQGHGRGLGHLTERSENILDLGQGNW